jgi:hypothetical protein
LLEEAPSKLKATDVLWNARAFDTDGRNLSAGRLQGSCEQAGKEIAKALEAIGRHRVTYTEPIHPFQTTPDGEPIHTAAAIVDYTRTVVEGVHYEVVSELRAAPPPARPHLEAARALLEEVLDEYARV